VDMTMERMIEKYNADLANGIGNLVSRVIKLWEGTDIQVPDLGDNNWSEFYKFTYDDLNINRGLDYIWEKIQKANKYIEDNKPWEMKKTDSKRFEKNMKELLLDLRFFSDIILPFMPETSEKIKKALETKEAVTLFPRMNINATNKNTN